ncbi:tyrosine aminotransferase-like isoform X2 [Tachypleus tridentatus]
MSYFSTESLPSSSCERSLKLSRPYRACDNLKLKVLQIHDFDDEIPNLVTRQSWNVIPSQLAVNIVSSIRSFLENIDIKPNPNKYMIALSIGDPTVYGNLKPHEKITEAIVDSVRSMKFNGYGICVGMEEAREAVAVYTSCPGASIEAKDVILTSGSSCALEMCITVLANPGQNILVPRPGFPFYRTLAESAGVVVKYYNHLPEQNWEVDLADLENQVDDNTAAVIVNNPSNPCGSVFSQNHIQAILDVAARNFVPIIADEIYEHFVFPGYNYHSIASLSTEVPVLSCSGLSKRFLVPGWRLGWITIHDRKDIFGHRIRKGLELLSQKFLGPCTLIQGALSTILKETTRQFFNGTVESVRRNAELSYTILSQVPGLNPVMPAGAMFMMVGIDMDRFREFTSDLEFVERMVSEQSVFCLPGTCFNYPDFMRIVLTVPEEQMQEACERIADFCSCHYGDCDNLNENEISQFSDV